MNAPFQNLVTALREELEQYGAMLALLDRQQELIIQRASGELLDNVASTNAQVSVIQVAQRVRTHQQGEVAQHLQLPATASFTDLAQRLPESFGVLIGALVAENNQCLMRIQRRARQNHLLLSRSVEMMQRLLGTLLATTQTTLYQGDGKLATAVTAGRPLCDACG